MEIKETTSFRRYSTLLAIVRVFLVLGLVFNLAALALPVGVQDKLGFSVGYDFGKLHLTRSVNKGGENRLSVKGIALDRVNRRVGPTDLFSAGRPLNDTLTLGYNGQSYQAVYSQEFSSAHISLPDGMANWIKNYIMLVLSLSSFLALFVIGRLRNILVSLANPVSMRPQAALDLKRIALVLLLVPVVFHLLDYGAENFLESTFGLRYFNSFGLRNEDFVFATASFLFFLLGYVLKRWRLSEEEISLTV